MHAAAHRTAGSCATTALRAPDLDICLRCIHPPSRAHRGMRPESTFDRIPRLRRETVQRRSSLHFAPQRRFRSWLCLGQDLGDVASWSFFLESSQSNEICILPGSCPVHTNTNLLLLDSSSCRRSLVVLATRYVWPSGHGLVTI